MAQEQSPTKLGYVCLAKLGAGTGGAAWSHIGCAGATFTCDEDFSQFGASGADEIAANGFARAAATMTTEQTTIANDTIQATHQFTATGSQDVYGFAVFNNATKGQGDPLLSCKFAAVQSMQTDDKLTCTGKCQIKKD